VIIRQKVVIKIGVSGHDRRSRFARDDEVRSGARRNRASSFVLRSKHAAPRSEMKFNLSMEDGKCVRDLE